MWACVREERSGHLKHHALTPAELASGDSEWRCILAPAVGNCFLKFGRYLVSLKNI